MSKPKTLQGWLAALTVLALAALAGSSWSDGKLEAHSRSRGAVLTGTWFLTLPTNELEALYTFHQGGTVSGVISSGFGGIPYLPAFGPQTTGADHGVWRRDGEGFQASVWRFDHELGSGNVIAITKIRIRIRFDRKWDAAGGDFFVTQWFCPTPVTCPDPNVVAPDVPELSHRSIFCDDAHARPLGCRGTRNLGAAGPPLPPATSPTSGGLARERTRDQSCGCSSVVSRTVG